MCVKTYYSNPRWQQILTSNNLTTFEQFWQLRLEAVDEGNVGRGDDGWSRVCIHTLDAGDGVSRQVIIKRQSNYRSRTLRHPLLGIPTFVKEYNFIRLYQQKAVPATTAVYCATRKQNGKLQAILVTEFLEGYRSLEDILQQWHTTAEQQRRKIITSVATLAAKLHNSGLEHRCLFPKHIFVPDNMDSEQACLIDLEKTRWHPWYGRRRLRDLAALARRTTMVNNRDRIRFFRGYFNIEQMDAKAKKLWRQIVDRRRKNNN